MFRVRIEALETYRNATRPLIMRSLECVQDNFSLNKNILTFFNGEAESVRLTGTTHDGKLRSDQYTDVGFDDRQFIEAEIEDAEANSELDSSHRHIVNAPVWHDKQSGAMIIPNYVTKKVNVTINRYCKDRVTAQRLRDKINSQLKEPRVDVFNASIHYPISNEMLLLGQDIYTMLVKGGKVNPNELNPLAWFKTACKVPHDVIANAIGNNACFVFKRSVDRIRLRFEGIDIAKSIAKGKYYGQYLLSFQYSFYYAELKQWELHYPIMVYQSILDPKWIPEDNEQYFDAYPTNTFLENKVGLQAGHSQYWNMPGLFVFPKEDYWRKPNVDYISPKLQRLATLDDVEEQVILNIFKFQGEEKFWDVKFKYFIQTHFDKVTKRHKAPFYLSVWSDNYQVLDSQIELKENGDLILKRRPTMSAAYRVVFSFDYAIGLYDPELINEITHDEDLGRWVIGILHPHLPLPGDPEYNGYTPYPNNGGNWIDWDGDVIGKLPPAPGPTNPQKDKVGPPIYMAEGFIIAHNQRTYKPRQFMPLDISATEYYRRK